MKADTSLFDTILKKKKKVTKVSIRCRGSVGKKERNSGDRDRYGGWSSLSFQIKNRSYYFNSHRHVKTNGLN